METSNNKDAARKELGAHLAKALRVASDKGYEIKMLFPDSPGLAMLTAYATLKIMEGEFKQVFPEKVEMYEKSKNIVDKIIAEVQSGKRPSDG